MSESVDWKKEVISVLEGFASSTEVHVKELRKQVFLSLQIEDDSEKIKKQHKKAFKGAVKSLEEDDGKLSLNGDGIITLVVKKNKKDKDKKKEKKKKKESKKRKKEGEEEEEEKEMNNEGKRKKMDDEDKNHDDENDADEDHGDDNKDDNNDNNDNDNDDKATDENKNEPCAGNPLGHTRLFLGNLPFAVDESALNEFLCSPNDDSDNNMKVLEFVKWITDKETGQFYGSAFVEIDNSKHAMLAVKKLNNKKLMGRPIKINFAPVKRPGVDIWPPKNDGGSGGGGGSSATTGATAGGKGLKAMGVKPENCYKLFIGNLSYEIDDDAINNFFNAVDAEIKAVRWLHHKESGDFKGCGFVEFWKTEACEKAATLNGKNLLGRPIRIDWSD